MEFRNPVYSSADNSTIDMEINHPKYGWIPFTASASDVEEHGRQLFADASTGSVAPYQAPSLEEFRDRMPTLTPRQFWLAAASINISKAQVLASVDADTSMNETDKMYVKIEITDAIGYTRTNPYVILLSQVMGVTDDELDSLWAWAAEL